MDEPRISFLTLDPPYSYNRRKTEMVSQNIHGIDEIINDRRRMSPEQRQLFDQTMLKLIRINHEQIKTLRDRLYLYKISLIVLMIVVKIFLG